MKISKTVKGLLSVLVIGSALGAASVQAAEEPQPPQLPTFFTAIEGVYDGHGSVMQLTSSGMRTINYRIHIRTDKSAQDVWDISNQVTTESGGYFQNAATFTVIGNTLLVSNGGGSHLVQVTELGPTSLTYKFNRADVAGRIYEFVYHTELDAAAHKLTGHNTVTTSGAIVSDEVFTATRW